MRTGGDQRLPALLNSGSITAAEYLETVELVIRQLTRHAAWACARVAPRLMQGYLPFPDEFDHKWIALARAGEGDYAAYRRWGYIAVNRGMAAYAELARGADGCSGPPITAWRKSARASR